jgi:aspartyl-tRNA(Asn)/glutamyl-tRNA(Gln) amidotransferase subunit C
MPKWRGDFKISHVAALARLQLTPDEEVLYESQLAGILGFAAEVLDLAAPGDGEPASPEDAALRLRPDEPVTSLSREDNLAMAPDADRRAGLFRVPKVLH